MSIPLFFIEITFLGATFITAHLYIILIIYIIRGWHKTPEYELPQDYTPTKFISVVIAARNEEQYIGKCIESILNCHYPKELYEIIVVNDHSEDNTEAIIKRYTTKNVHFINLTDEKGKKAALEKAISTAKGELIACTDADCLVPQNWLLLFESHFEFTKSKSIAGPISYIHDDSMIQNFQFIDGLNNMSVTANGITRKIYHMANGANFWFTKEVFNEVGGYLNKDQFASGDDMFLIQEISNLYPDKITFLKSKQAIVKTHPEFTFNNLVQQRERWASKSKGYTNKNILWIQGFVFSFALLILISLAISHLGSAIGTVILLYVLIVKISVDYLYLSKISSFFGFKIPMVTFMVLSLIYLVYITYIGFKSLNPTAYSWKGRTTR